ncbi:MAG: o-succinylbenzoate synthase [Acidobacteria bacterium]|nr:o-succinylbenzoate synthase [Acidobacteriota bacterium]
MQILELDLREVRLPLCRPFVTAAGRTEVRRTLVLAAVDEEGRRGWSECVALERPDYLPETLDLAWWTLQHWFAPRLLGHELADPATAETVLAAGVRGHAMARASLEMLCWELEAQRREVPLARLLGGERETVDAGLVLGIEPSVDQLVERVERAVTEGYRRIKLKIAPGADLEPLTAAREAVGPTVALAADGNCAYTLDDADHLARLDGLGLEFLEQPLGWDDLAEHAVLQRRLATSLCLDESVRSEGAARSMLALGAARVLNLKPARVGGFGAAKRIHDLCRQRDVPVWCGGMLESGIGRAYTVALASLPGFTLASDHAPSAHYWQRDLVRPGWTMDAEGRIRVPHERPGLGVDVDLDALDDLTVRRVTLRAR